MLRAQGWTTEDQDHFLTALKSNYTSASLPPSDQALLDYAVKLTRQPSDMTATDVNALRTVGFDDRAIHDICVITSYYAFVNRIADGLGVELEERFTRK